MNRSDFETKVAALLGGPIRVAHDAVDAVLGAITEAVARGEEVRLVGFGSFSVRVSPSTTGRNPRTGEALEIPEKRVVKFRAGRELKDAAANGKEERAA